MTLPAIKVFPKAPDAIAPDGLEVRILGLGRHGSLAHFRLHAGQTSKAIRHRTVEEAWHIVAGSGSVWFSAGGSRPPAEITAGASFIIPPGTAFQLRNTGTTPLDAVCATMPPWPGDNEAEFVAGHWPA